MTLRAETVTRSEQRTVRTEITVREAERTLLMLRGTATDTRFCPLCGHPTEPEAAEKQAASLTSASSAHAPLYPGLEAKLQRRKKQPARRRDGR